MYGFFVAAMSDGNDMDDGGHGGVGHGYLPSYCGMRGRGRGRGDPGRAGRSRAALPLGFDEV